MQIVMCRDFTGGVENIGELCKYKLCKFERVCFMQASQAKQWVPILSGKIHEWLILVRHLDLGLIFLECKDCGLLTEYACAGLWACVSGRTWSVDC